MTRFEGRVAVVTGGGSGIGRATALRLAAEGARVWVLDHDEGAAQTVARYASDQALDVRAAGADVADRESVRAAVQDVLNQGGQVDVLVNNAGIAHSDSVWETSSHDWGRVLDVNLTGVFHGMAEVLPSMTERGHGAVVNVSSDAGLVGWERQAAYCASKSGVLGLTRAGAMDAAPYGVRVNAVCPAFTRTPLVEQWIESSADPAAERAAVSAEQPLGRMAAPAEIASAIAFLASDEAAFITGVALPVDGGVTAR